jgi:GNAT superfamily N-acetyltransferase
MFIRAIHPSEVKVIQDLAHRIWPDTFSEILSEAQIEYMLNWMYSPEKLNNQLKEGHHFFLLVDEVPIGFVGIEHQEDGRVKIHKLYLLPSEQRKGLGKRMLDFVIDWAKERGAPSVYLNVNRYNKAVDFYQHIGMNILHSEDIDIGNGYLMEDYVMELPLN